MAIFSAQTSSILGITSDQNAVIPASPGLTLLGWCARESSGVTGGSPFDRAQVLLVHGPLATGTDHVGFITLVLSQQREMWYSDIGIDISSGLSLDWELGTIDLILYFKDYS